MLRRLSLLLAAFFFLIRLAVAQNEDPVLFTIDKTPVHLSEFKYIYNKTSGEKADYSRASLEDYLDRYVNFKLKVKRARDMKLDTISALQKELDGYRRQLADSYLIDREVTDRLIKEAYERTLKDVAISHIMISVSKNATPADTLAAYNKAMDIYNRLNKGEQFESLAKELSDDKSAKDNNGVLGFVTAVLPDGFYDLESAIYNNPKGSIVKPVRSPIGYHILRIDDSRPARGEMEVAHILIRNTKDKPNPNAKSKIDSLYLALQKGEKFDDLATNFSEDNQTNKKGGYLGFFGINRYERTFEEAAFALQNDGDFTKPFETSAGWHIVKRISRKQTDPYEVAKNRLKPRIQRDGRYELAKLSMVERIKREGNFRENSGIVDKFIATLDSTFLTPKWKAPEKSAETIFTLGENKTFSLGDFTEFIFLNSRKRLESGPNANNTDVVKRIYKDFISESCLRYEETQLDKKYPDFRSLMREYEEGILLFEATKDLVWDKASQDTVGLEKYFSDYKIKYQWEDRAVVSMFSVSNKLEAEIEKIRKMASKKETDKVLTKYNNDKEEPISVHEETYEKGRNKVIDALEWKAGSLTGTEVNKKDNTLNFMKIEKIIPRSQKTLKEARGYVVADYQDYLEKKWIEDLKKDYKVEINQDIFNKMVK